MLEVKVNKTLKLVGHLKRELRNIQQSEVDKAIYMMESFVKSKKIQTMGPLITVTHDSVLQEREGVLVNIDLILQIKSFGRSNEPYQYISSDLKINNCIYVRYKGKIEELSYGYIKLELFIWENKLIKSGPIYTIFADMKNSEDVIVDIFIPVEE